MTPPSLLYFRVNRFRLWLPLFLVLWPLFVLAAPFAALACLFSPLPGRALRELYALVCALRGLDVHVDQPGQFIKIRFI